MPTLREWLRKKMLSFKGLAKYEGTPGDDRLTFVNDEENVIKTKIREYDIWYTGDSDELLNFYTRQNTIDYNTEPWYDRNKRSYFWCVTSTEEDVKRSHSGQPRNIIDTLVSIIGKPDIQGGDPKLGRDNPINNRIDEIIRANNFWKMYTQLQMPLTLVEGWGCYKINWDDEISDYPIIQYYKAENVDFIYKSNKLVGVIFKDYYTDLKNKKYLIIETRTIKNEKNKKTGENQKNLYIDKEAFEVYGEDDMVRPIKMKDVEQLKDIEEHVVIENFAKLLAVPCVFYEDTNVLSHGRSIFTGKLDLFDDLDQCLSQAANTVRKSTPVEYFNSDFLERDRHTGLPVQPKAFDRKYTMYAGGKTTDGAVNTNMPIQVTQPNLDFEQYSNQAISILMQIINGIMSPATLGIDISKRDNAEAQREKEKVTIFTRNMLIDIENEILKDLFSQLLCAYECMTTGKITVKNYDISVTYNEFADDSFENKLRILGDALNRGNISPKMFMTKLYGHTLSDTDFEEETEYLKQSIQAQQQNPFEMQGEENGQQF